MLCLVEEYSQIQKSENSKIPYQLAGPCILKWNPLDDQNQFIYAAQWKEGICEENNQKLLCYNGIQGSAGLKIDA